MDAYVHGQVTKVSYGAELDLMTYSKPVNKKEEYPWNIWRRSTWMK